MAGEVIRLSPRTELARERAKNIQARRYEIAPAEIGGLWGLDLGAYVGALCGGAFPRVGECRYWIDEDQHLQFEHVGCLALDVGNWAYDPSEDDYPGGDAA